MTLPADTNLNPMSSGRQEIERLGEVGGVLNVKTDLGNAVPEGRQASEAIDDVPSVDQVGLDVEPLGHAPNHSRKIAYRGWWITFDPPPIPIRSCDWQFWHDDYDGAPTYSDEGPADSRCGSAPSLEAAKAEIDDWYKEQAA